VADALTLGYKISAESKSLGLYLKLQEACVKYFKSKGNKPVPAHLQGSTKVNLGMLQSEYNSAIKKKDMEINSQKKSLIKDSMRISLKELG